MSLFMKSKSAAQLDRAFESGEIQKIMSYFNKPSDIGAWQAEMRQLRSSTLPFMYRAAAKGYNDVINRLNTLGIGPDNGTAPSGYTPLIAALNNDHVETAALLLSLGAKADYTAPDGMTPLTCAIRADNWDFAKDLLTKYMAPAQDQAALTHIAANPNKFRFYELLLRHNAAPERIETRDATPLLSVAIINRNDKVVEHLLAAKAKLNQKDKSGYTPLYHALVKYPEKPYFENIMAKNPDVQDKNAFIHILNTPSLMPIYEQLVAAGAKPAGMVFEHGERLLYKAVGANNEAMVAALLRDGADTAAITNNKETALHIAIKKERPHLVKLLLAHHAPLDIRDKNDQTPVVLAEARRKNNPEMLEMILRVQNGQMPQTVAAPALPPVPVAEAEQAADDALERWHLLDDEQAAYVCNAHAIRKRITHIFNFKSHERLTIIDDIMSLQQSALAPKHFSEIDSDALKDAFNAYQKLDGKIPEDKAIGNIFIGNNIFKARSS